MGKNWQEMKVLLMTVHSVQIRSQDGRPTAVFSTISGNLDVSNNVRKFYGQYNNIRTVLGYGTCEIRVVHLCKVYCLSALMYTAVKVGIYKIRSRAEFLSLGIIALDQYSTAVGENPSTLYSISVKFCL